MTDERRPSLGLARPTLWDSISRLRGRRRLQNTATLGLVILGPVLVLTTLLALGPFDLSVSPFSLRVILLIDLCYILVVAALVLFRVAQMISARRARSAGSRLHLRLTRLFVIITLVPTVSVAIFAGLTVNVGLEGWFSERVGGVVRNSLAAAEAYEEEHRRDLAIDARILASAINRARAQNRFGSDGQIRQVLTSGQSTIQRGLREAYVIDGSGEIRARGERSYLFDFEQPTREQIETAREDGILVIQDWDNNEFRALVPLSAYIDRLLYVSRNVDGEILNLLDETQETVRLYQQLEKDRGAILFEFGLLYLGFALILILAAIWLGLWFAERLSRPVGRLAGAAQRVGAGDLDVRVHEEPGDDEIAMLGRLFNQMTHQLKGQRNALLDNTESIERRRRLFDSVLGSVTAGVVGLDDSGHVTFVNKSAARLLDVATETDGAVPLAVAVPEFSNLLETLKDNGQETAQEQVRVTRKGVQEQLLVRMSLRRSAEGQTEGYVIAFDDVTDLVSAQRMAAWGDVARRIAHEIKNPLTPIQLSAERIKRKFDSEGVDQLTDVIIRQTNDLRRIVDEFSKFARMPEPETKVEDLIAIARDAVTLQEAAMPDVALSIRVPDAPIMVEVDATMIGQACTNLVKNAGEAIESYVEKSKPLEYSPEIRVQIAAHKETVELVIEDNGTGLPQDRARLFEPYVTTRDKGTGLGLPIVRKIVEEHGGTLRLDDAEIFEGNDHAGARVTITLPMISDKENDEDSAQAAE